MEKYLGVVLLGLLLSACGELSYKQGGSAQDLSRTKKLCQSEGLKTDAEISQCLDKNGWSVHQLDDLDLFAVASVTPNNHNADAKENKIVIDGTEAIESEKASPMQTSAHQENLTQENMAQVNSESINRENNGAPASKPAKVTSPLDIYVVSSWWKMGSNPKSLEMDTNACVASLGEAHQPNPKTQQVTRGFVVCMFEKGWKALKVK